MAIAYFDTYLRRDGARFFGRRDEQHWYAVDVLARPSPPEFQHWPRWQDRKPHLPADFPTWSPFWDDVPTDEIARLTAKAVG